MPGADVVTVPDFSGPAASLFEVRTLLFLGSWLDHAGEARDWPLHLACVGEPPPRVRALAERAGAHISLHAALENGRIPTYNKLLGFDIGPRTERLLLVDTDVLFLGDPSALDRLDDRLSLIPAGSHRIPPEMWQRGCAALGRQVPTKRILCQRGELADRIPVRAVHGPKHRERMIPYYNSGVLMIPWRDADAFRKHWLDVALRLVEHFPPEVPEHQKISKEDQYGMALVVDDWERERGEIQRLPPPLHSGWLQVMAGVLRADEVAVYHAVHFLRLGDAQHFDALAEVDAYGRFILEHVYPPDLSGRALAAWRRLSGEPEPIRQVRALIARIRAIVERYAP
jgi:hypothetical protein